MLLVASAAHHGATPPIDAGRSSRVARAAAASHLGGVAGEGGGRSSRSAMVTPVRRLQRWAGHTTLPGPRCDRPRSWVSADEPGCH